MRTCNPGARECQGSTCAVEGVDGSLEGVLATCDDTQENVPELLTGDPIRDRGGKGCGLVGTVLADSAH